MTDVSTLHLPFIQHVDSLMRELFFVFLRPDVTDRDVPNHVLNTISRIILLIYNLQSENMTLNAVSPLNSNDHGTDSRRCVRALCKTCFYIIYLYRRTHV